MDTTKRPSGRDRRAGAFRAFAEFVGRPFVNRRPNIGDRPRFDPHALDFDLIDPPRRWRLRTS